MIPGSSEHVIRELPIVVLFPHNRCNCRCVMCDIWKIREVREITEHDLEPHISSFRDLKVRWVVFSGGEPLLHSDLATLCRLLRRQDIRLTLLTAGISLERDASSIKDLVDDIIVSIDGPGEIHDEIRNIPGAYRQLARGVSAIRRLRPEMPIHGRCTVQKRNCGNLCTTVDSAHSLELDSLSFLAADVRSTAFNRPDGWTSLRRQDIALAAQEIVILDAEIERLIHDFQEDIDCGFIVEKPSKLRRIGLHFRAQVGWSEPVSPRCNAPWVSTVIEADGTVRPCFFHPPIGNIHDLAITEILNGDRAIRFRQQLHVPTNATCRNCVCSLFLPSSESS